MRLYSTADERGFDLKRLFVCLSAKCRRDARDPLVSPAIQNRRQHACKKRNAGAKGSHSPQDRGRPACRRLYSTANEHVFDLKRILFAFRQSAGETPAIRWSRLHFRIAGDMPACGCTQPLMSE
ncbi:MAG: hypothetical protein LBP59_18135, partial [Planctomycetaceae bacterium]|nr:hypothetical protein [Planctomycetaceae bacterium]